MKKQVNILNYMLNFQETIAALATPEGQGAIGIVRVSGTKTIEIVNKLFYGKNLLKVPSHTIHFGSIRDHDEMIDEVIVSIFKTPRSYTLEDVIEISSHGSPYILQRILSLLVQEGIRIAAPGEFTQRAFLNGRFDLTQAEAVADLIASENKMMQQTAILQMRGGFSSKIKDLRKQLIHFASMIELELDFSEENVEFANRKELLALIEKIQELIQQLINGFEYGNAIKNGIPTVIAGRPNVGKSTLLNALLSEEKALVSEIPGTTRDLIEDQKTIKGITYRFIDTAGIRETMDIIESMGIKRTKEKMEQASLIIYLIDLENDTPDSIKKQIAQLSIFNKKYLVVGNKLDVADKKLLEVIKYYENVVLISAQQENHLPLLTDAITKLIEKPKSDVIITNVRHLESLKNTFTDLERVIQGIQEQLPSDLLAQDVREALFHLGEITGEVNTDDLLDNIFSKFCIGK